MTRHNRQSTRRTARLRAVTAAVVLGLSSASVWAAGGQGATLVDATQARDGKAVTALLQRGADVNAGSPDGTTPLHWAAHHGDVSVVNALIRAKANVNIKNRYGVAPIWLAATNGHALAVEALLRAGADPQTSRADSGETVLMAAAMAGQVDVMQRLLAHGADPNAKDSVRGQTALMWAAAERHKAAARVLVEVGADIEARSSTGLTPLMFAIRSGDIDTTLGLLDLGANLKGTAPDGTTMLALSIINAHWELAAKLLDRGADPNGTDPRGRPLHILTMVRRAENRGLSAWLPRKPTGNIDSIDLVKALLAKGAKINDRIEWKNPNYNPTHIALGLFAATTYQGATAIYIAAKNCDVELVKFLAANGADPKIPTTQNVTPLLAAAGIGYAIGESAGTPEEALETVKLLTELGADLKGTTDFSAGRPAAAAGGAGGGRGGGGGGGGGGGMGGNGWDGATALHGAVIRGAKELVVWLIEQGVPLDHKSKAGDVPLDLARGSSLGVTYHVQPELADIIEKAMVAKGMPVSEHKYGAERAQRP